MCHSTHQEEEEEGNGKSQRHKNPKAHTQHKPLLIKMTPSRERKGESTKPHLGDKTVMRSE